MENTLSILTNIATLLDDVDTTMSRMRATQLRWIAKDYTELIARHTNHSIPCPKCGTLWGADDAPGDLARET